jgi:hypothetical protein
MNRCARLVALAIAATVPLAAQTPTSPRFRVERSIEVSSPGGP